jgi:hypothetical protein
MKPKYILTALGSLALILAVALSVRAEKARGAGGNRVQGAIASVDTEGKKITVKGREGEKTVAVPEGTTVTKLTTMPLADLTDGQVVSVVGKKSADKQSIEARLIVALQSTKGKRGKAAKGEDRLGVTGTLAKNGDALSLKTRKETVTLTTSAKTKAAKEAPAAFADLTPGTAVVIFTTGDDAQLSATKVVIEPAGLKLDGKGGGKGGRKRN